MAKGRELHDRVDRTKRFDLPGTSLFIGLRIADGFLQYNILRRGWASNLIEFCGGTPVSAGQLFNATGNRLQPYFIIILLMSLGSSLKQIVTAVHVTETAFPPKAATIVATFNTIINTLNTVFSVWAATSQVSEEGGLLATTQSPMVVLGTAFYLVGIFTEMVSELQRTQFKKDSANKGKPFDGGLFGLARHVNYGGYTIWRAAFSFTAGGWLWGIGLFSYFSYDFAFRGVPVLDRYLQQRYGGQWTNVKQRVPYALFPGTF
ncbi:hypothetical protein LIA77_05131 [Sarocladium implicatum]|nr:hypothetical protein LIA77_05131 [Sarocladium implicatum]